LLNDLKNDNLQLWSMIKKARGNFSTTKECVPMTWEYKLDSAAPLRLENLWKTREGLLSDIRSEPTFQELNFNSMNKILNLESIPMTFIPAQPSVPVSLPPVVRFQIMPPVFQSSEPVVKIAEAKLPVAYPVPETNYNDLYMGFKTTEMPEPQTIKEENQELKNTYPGVYEYFRTDLTPETITIETPTEPVKVLEVKTEGDFLQTISSSKDIQETENKLKQIAKNILGKLPQFTFLRRGSNIWILTFSGNTDISDSAMEKFKSAVATIDSNAKVNVKITTIEQISNENLATNFEGEITEERLKGIEPAKLCVDAEDPPYDLTKFKEYIPVPEEYKTRNSTEQCNKPILKDNSCSVYGKDYVPYLHHDTTTDKFQACCTELKNITQNPKITKPKYIEEYNNIRRKAYNTLVQFYDNIVKHNNTLTVALKTVKKKVTSEIYNKVSRTISEYISTTDSLKHDINDCLTIQNDDNQKECMNLYEFLNRILPLYQQHNDAYSLAITIVTDLDKSFFTHAYQSSDSLLESVKKFTKNVWLTFRNWSSGTTLWAKSNKFYIMVMGYNWCSALVPVVYKLGNALLDKNNVLKGVSVTQQLIVIFTSVISIMPCVILQNPIYLGIFIRKLASLIIKCLHPSVLKTVIWTLIKYTALGPVTAAVYVAGGVFGDKKKKSEDYLKEQDQVIDEIRKGCTSEWISTGVFSGSAVSQAVVTIFAGYLNTYLSNFIIAVCITIDGAKKLVDKVGKYMSSSFLPSFIPDSWSPSKLYMNYTGSFLPIGSNYMSDFGLQMITWSKTAAEMIDKASQKHNAIVMAFELLPVAAITALTVMGLVVTYVDPVKIEPGDYTVIALKDKIQDEIDTTSTGGQKPFSLLK
jgi:hypothetical protein